jgi:hypothetical protein
VADGGDVDAVGVAGIDADSGDLASVFKADRRPGGACVGGLIGAMAYLDVVADAGRAGADVDDVGIGD